MGLDPTAMIKALCIDRDGVIVHHSSDPASPFYYITTIRDLVLKPNVREAFELLNTLRKARGLKVYMATKQRCISKGIMARVEVDQINDRLQTNLGFRFDGVYVEESAPDKRALYAAVLKDSGTAPDEIMHIDDSPDESRAWQASGGLLGQLIGTEWDLYDAVCHAFSIS